MPVSYTHAKEKARSHKSYSVGLIFIVASTLYVVLPYSSLANDSFDRMRVFEPLWTSRGTIVIAVILLWNRRRVGLARIHTREGETQTKQGIHIWTFTHVRERYDLLASEWRGHSFLACNFCIRFISLYKSKMRT